MSNFDCGVKEFLGNECSSFEDDRLSSESVHQIALSVYTLESSFAGLYDGHNPDTSAIPRKDMTGSLVPEKVHIRSLLHNHLSNIYTFSQCIEQVTEREFGQSNAVYIRTNNDDQPPHNSITQYAQFLLGLRNLVQHGFTDSITIDIQSEDVVAYVTLVDFYSSRNWSREGATVPYKYTEFVDERDSVDILSEINDFQNKVRGLVEPIQESNKTVLGN